MQDRAEQLAAEAIEVSRHIDMVARLSNLALQFIAGTLRYGHARNEEDEKGVKKFMKENLPKMRDKRVFMNGFTSTRVIRWYAFIRQDFLQYYRYTQKWVDLFQEQPLMIRVETGHYIKGMHNLLNAHFDLRNYRNLKPI